jgi:mono/diheme cytochrome c family protein
MKKTFVLSVLVITVLACHRNSIPAAATPAPVTDIPEVMHDETATADASRAELITQGKTVYINRCGRCHGLKRVENFTATRWDGILKIMIPKARLNETEAQQVTAYVLENAGK